MSGLGAALAAVISFAVTSVLGIWMIPFFKKLHFGQSILDIGPVWHKSKQGTPPMGGLMFICGIMLAGAIILLFGDYLQFDFLRSEKKDILLGLFLALLFGAIGFADDYIKVVKKRNMGLTAKQKFLLQILAALFYLLIIYISGQRQTAMMVPFTDLTWDPGIFYWPLALFIIVGTVNAVNLTDGVDGLAASVTTVVALAFMFSAKVMLYSGFAALGAALAGGCLGFLVWNLHPAKVFMGDTGSLFLGGMACALAFGIHQPLLLIPFGIIYIVEVLSDVIQITSFKTTHKRVFKMAPIHHHFELCGWSEMKIVFVFSLITMLFSVGGIIWLVFAMH